MISHILCRAGPLLPESATPARRHPVRLNRRQPQYSVRPGSGPGMRIQGFRGANARSIKRALLAGLVSLGLHGPALGKDSEDDGEASTRSTPSIPNLYLDLRTYYATVPSGAISVGFGNSGLLSTLQTLQALSDANRFPGQPGGQSSNSIGRNKS